ncbi:MAG: hypothetical protein EOM20_21670, partial [Spartobacteria bacterium]|nr:hypothetical protein [Spartobacteria bacterium]
VLKPSAIRRGPTRPPRARPWRRSGSPCIRPGRWPRNGPRGSPPWKRSGTGSGRGGFRRKRRLSRSGARKSPWRLRRSLSGTWRIWSRWSEG